jgi:hypothetical protein
MSEKKNRAERLQERQENSSKRGGGFQKVLNIPEGIEKFNRAIEEQQTIAIVPFIVTSNIHPEYTAIMKDVEEYGDPSSAFKMDYYIHNVPGMRKEVICHNMTYGKNSCPICAERARLLKEGYEWDSKEVKPYNAKHRTAHVVCLIDDPENPLVVMDEPYGWWGKILEGKAKEQNVLLLDETQDGSNVQFFSMEHSWKNDKGEEITMAGKCSVKFCERSFGFEEADMAEIDLCSFFTIDSEEEIYNTFHAIEGSISSSTKEEDKEIIPPKTAEAPTGGTSEARTPNTNSRRGRRGGNPEASAGGSTPRSRSRAGRGGGEKTFTEDEITY